jgi:hypothetical protein
MRVSPSSAGFIEGEVMRHIVENLPLQALLGRMVGQDVVRLA